MNEIEKSIRDTVTALEKQTKSILYPDLTPPKFPINDFVIPPNPLIREAQENYASEFHKRLLKRIDDFDASLDQEHEVGVCLVSFGQSVVFHLNEMGYWNPSLISFKGTTEEGNPVELIQHVSQINVLLMKLRRKDSTQPKRRIGFITPENPEDASTR